MNELSENEALEKEATDLLVDLETDITSRKTHHERANAFHQAEELYNAAGMPELARECELRKMAFYAFILQYDGQMYWHFEPGDHFGSMEESFFTSEASKTKNPFHGARYREVLLRLTGHYKQAELAIAAHLDAVDCCEANGWGPEMLAHLLRAQSLARQYNFRPLVDRCIEKTHHLLKSFDRDNASVHRVRQHLVDTALEHKKEYGPEFWEDAIKACRDSADALSEQGNFFFARVFPKQIEAILRVLGRNDGELRELEEEIAASYVAEADYHRQAGNPAESAALEQAIEAYQQLGDVERANQLKKELQRTLNEMKFGRIEVPIQVPIGHFRALAEELAALPPQDTLKVIATDPQFIPPYDVLCQQEKESSADTSLVRWLPTRIFDAQMHPIKGYTTDEEREYHRLLQIYGLYFQAYYALFVQIVLGTLCQHPLSAFEVLRFLREHSSFSKELIDLLEPGIESHFAYEFVLSIDSLIPKIEEALRQVFASAGREPIEIKTLPEGRSVRQSTITDLLYDEYAEQILGPDLLMITRFALIEQAGLNLRHRVSHCLMKPADYNSLFSNLLLLLLLRIGALRIEEVRNSA